MSSSAKSVQVASSETECRANSSRPARLGVISQVTCLMPFSQMSSLRPLVSSGHAQPGQSKPPFSWFILKMARGPSTKACSFARTCVTLFAAPQPAAGWW